MSTPDPIITVTHTIMDGAVVRWYRTLDAATYHRATLSASREGVLVENGEYLNRIPEQWIADAHRAHAELAADRGADVSGWATHQRREVLGVRGGPLEPVNKEG